MMGPFRAMIIVVAISDENSDSERSGCPMAACSRSKRGDERHRCEYQTYYMVARPQTEA